MLFFILSLKGNSAPVYRISTTFGETFHYSADELRRVDVETCNVLLTICGRNRVTTQGQPIACVTLPLAGYAKMVKPEWYPLTYKILLPSGYDVAEERESLRGSRSWEQKGASLQRNPSFFFFFDTKPMLITADQIAYPYVNGKGQFVRVRKIVNRKIKFILHR